MSGALDRIRFREVRPTDIPRCFEIESLSYPIDEQASKSTLQYRQHHAAAYFRCAVIYPDVESSNAHTDDHDDIEDALLVGFVCSTRCQVFTHDSFTTHIPSGLLLAVHSVVVHPNFRRQGIATALLNDYLQCISDANSTSQQPLDKIVLLAKERFLGFYMEAGFCVRRPSPITHGKDLWYECEYNLPEMRCYHVNAFGTASFLGNPAAVVLIDSDKEAEELLIVKHDWMQKVAAQFNLSETAFVVVPSNPASNHIFQIRFYTPSTKIDLCGHATLASASILFQANIVDSQQPVVFQTSLGKELVCKCTNSSRPRSTAISMDFPIQPATEVKDKTEQHAILEMLTKSVGISAADVQYVGLSKGLGDLLIEVSFQAFKSIRNVHYSALLEWDGYSRGVILCCRSDPAKDEGFDFLSRFFAPKAGIDEDPVTGSAHCALAPHFWSPDSEKIVGRQDSRRQGRVECQLIEDKKVRLTGLAVTVMQGNLFLRS